MAQINLLPWREELRQEKKKEFLSQLALVGVLAVVVCFVWVQVVDSKVARQSERNAMLNNEINLLKKKVKEIQELKKDKRELLGRIQVIQDLEGKRSIIVRYFDELARAVPDGVFLTSVTRSTDQFSIEGVSESNQRISEFMRKLDESSWFANPNFKNVVVGKKSGERSGVFSMTVSTVLPEEEAK